jgi:hypothetical protein
LCYNGSDGFLSFVLDRGTFFRGGASLDEIVMVERQREKGSEEGIYDREW